MSSKVPYLHPLKNQEAPLPSQQKMTRLLRCQPDQDHKQAIKKGFKVFHKISVKSKDPSQFLPPAEILGVATYIKKLKRTKPLPRLEIEMNSVRLSDESIVKFFQSLKQTKSLSEIHFDFRHNGILSLHGSRFASKALCYIRALPRLKIKLSLFVEDRLLRNEEMRKMLKRFNKHKCFASAHFSPQPFCGQILEMEEAIARFKHSKSLSKLSLVLHRDRPDETSYQKLQRHFLSESRGPLPFDGVFSNLKRIKTLKNCRVHFQRCDINNLELKALLPLFKEAAQSSNLEILIDESLDDGYELSSWITKFEWWMFKRTIRNLNPYHTVSAKHIGTLRDYSSEFWIKVCFLLIVGMLFIKLVQLVMT